MFSQELADRICEGLAEGKSLRAVCAADDMPSPATVLRWTAEDDKAEFSKQYTHARAIGYALRGDEIAEMCEAQGEDSAVAVARDRLKVDTLKWTLARMLPKIYGDKVETVHSGSVQFQKIECVVVDPKG